MDVSRSKALKKKKSLIKYGSLHGKKKKGNPPFLFFSCCKGPVFKDLIK